MSQEEKPSEEAWAEIRKQADVLERSFLAGMEQIRYDAQQFQEGYMERLRELIALIRGQIQVEPYYVRLETFRFSTRVRFLLQRNGIRTLGRLLEYDEGDLLAIPMMGVGSVKEIKARLNDIGCELGSLKKGNKTVS